MKTGIRLRTLLDGTIAQAMRTIDLSNYQDRQKLIDYIEARIIESDWVSVYNGTCFDKSKDYRTDTMKQECFLTQIEWEKNFNF
jgi:hypothetical protein